MTDEEIEQEMDEAGRIARLAERSTAAPVDDRLAAGLRWLDQMAVGYVPDVEGNPQPTGYAGPCPTCGAGMSIGTRLTCVPTGVCRWKERVAWKNAARAKQRRCA